MISSQTRDFVFRLAACVAAIAIIAPILASCAAVFVFGDGEGLRILGSMTAPIVGGLGTFTATMGSVLLHAFITGAPAPVSPASGQSSQSGL